VPHTSAAWLKYSNRFWAFFLFYGLFRFVTEFFRQPDAHIGFVWASFSMGQLLSLPMLIGGVLMIGWRFMQASSNIPEKRPPVS